MHTCIFNSLSEDDHDFITGIANYLFHLIDFVVIGVDSTSAMSKVIAIGITLVAIIEGLFVSTTRHRCTVWET